MADVLTIQPPASPQATLIINPAGSGSGGVLTNAVAMPTTSADAGSAGDYAIDADTFAIYNSTTNEWSFFDLYAK